MCNITLQYVSGSGCYLIDDLGLSISSVEENLVSHLFSVQDLIESQDLHSAILNGDIEAKVNGQIVQNVNQLCNTGGPPSELANNDRWTWEAGRKGSINVSAIDLVRLDSSATSDLPFIALKDSSINLVAARSQTDLDWNFQIIKSSDNGVNWTVVRTETVDTQTKVFDYVATIPLAQGDLVRLRFVKISNAIQHPQVTLLVRET